MPGAGLDLAPGEHTLLAQLLLGRLRERLALEQHAGRGRRRVEHEGEQLPVSAPMSTMVEYLLKSYTAAAVGQSSADSRVVASLKTEAKPASWSR